MSTWEPHALTCPSCGHGAEVALLKGMHITRLPEVKAAIRDGTFQVFQCGGCGTPMHVEKATIYTDFEAGHYVGVEVAGGTDWAEAKERHRKVYDDAFLIGPPAAAELALSTRHRVVFGLRALREKVLAWDAGLDDAMVEVAKLRLMERDRIRYTEQELRLVAVLPPGDHLLFARYARAEGGPPHRPRVLGHLVAQRGWFDKLFARREEHRETYPWVFDDWFVDATHRLR